MEPDGVGGREELARILSLRIQKLLAGQWGMGHYEKHAGEC